MPEQLLLILAFTAAVGAGIIGGVFYAFSTFVMKALARLPAGEAVAAMNAINIVVINPMFLGVFLGTAALCIATLVGPLLNPGEGAGWLLAGSILYFLGTFLVTMLFNVPLNNRLAAVAPGDPDAAHHWNHYLARWTMWNHVRTAAALAAMIAFILALTC